MKLLMILAVFAGILAIPAVAQNDEPDCWLCPPDCCAPPPPPPGWSVPHTNPCSASDTSGYCDFKQVPAETTDVDDESSTGPYDPGPGPIFNVKLKLDDGIIGGTNDDDDYGTPDSPHFRSR